MNVHRIYVKSSSFGLTSEKNKVTHTIDEYKFILGWTIAKLEKYCKKEGWEFI